MAGLVAGAFSMALGEYASVSTQNEAIDKEVAVEAREIAENPRAETAELAGMFVGMGMTERTAATAAGEIHRDQRRAVRLHVSAGARPRPGGEGGPVGRAPISSFVMFAIGAASCPCSPTCRARPCLARASPPAPSDCSSPERSRPPSPATAWWWGALRQLAYGALAAAARTPPARCSGSVSPA